jgi:Lipoprotein LpqB beta-propeller domain/Sporulation and spore germination
MSRRTPLVRSALAAAVCALLAGCVQMPTEGPVEEPDVNGEVEDVPGVSFDPRPPRSGESPTEIVEGFLEAMKATPIRPPTVARQFLSRAAANTWVPERQVITYADRGSLTGASTVEIPMTDVNLYDARGAWQRTRAVRDLDLQLVEEDGEWRIDQVPDALIVPDSWFDDWYQRVSLYFFDPSSEVLVPEPVFMPRGDQLASSLVRGLLTPPSGESQDVSRTYFPTGTRQGLSVPVSSGIADVSLSGDPETIDEETAQRMLAQLVWTLRQEPRIRAVQLSVGGQAFGGSSGSTQVNLDVGSAYDPNGERPSSDMYALAEGHVVRGAIGDFEPTLGPLGQAPAGIRSISVSVSGARVAGVSRAGGDLLLAPTEAPDGELVTAISGAVDLAVPSWDYRDRAWVLDRGAGSARVIVVVDGTARVVRVPGLSGRTVTQLLVSRDGSRMVAVVRGRKADRVVAARIRQDAAGAVLGFTPLRTLPLPPEGSPRIRDVAWRSPTSVSVLSDINEDYSQVRTVSVDGAPGEIDTGDTTRSRDRIRSLVSSPVDGTEVFALAGRTVISLSRPERSVPDLPRGLTSLTYAG